MKSESKLRDFLLLDILFIWYIKEFNIMKSTNVGVSVCPNETCSHFEAQKRL